MSLSERVAAYYERAYEGEEDPAVLKSRDYWTKVAGLLDAGLGALTDAHFTHLDLDRISHGVFFTWAGCPFYLVAGSSTSVRIIRPEWVGGPVNEAIMELRPLIRRAPRVLHDQMVAHIRALVPVSQ
jgi:hypothetical protein